MLLALTAKKWATVAVIPMVKGAMIFVSDLLSSQTEWITNTNANVTNASTPMACAVDKFSANEVFPRLGPRTASGVINWNNVNDGCK